MQLTRPGNESGVAGADEASASCEGLAAAVGEERLMLRRLMPPRRGSLLLTCPRPHDK